MKTNPITPTAPNSILHRFRTLLVDDHALLRSYVHHFLDTQGMVHVVGTASSGSEALLKAVALAPDLVLMDLQMPGMNGLQATELLRRRLPKTRIIIMTMEESVRCKAAALAHGAHGFVAKSRMADELMPEVRRVCAR